jgi:hypothetical protein
MIKQTFPVDIRLGGHAPTTGSISAFLRSSRERAGRAAGTLFLFLVIGAAVAVIPPHIPWAAIALIAGIFLAAKQWRSEYQVEHFTGACPRCGTELPIKPEAGIRFPLQVTCFECHHEPVVNPRP